LEAAEFAMIIRGERGLQNSLKNMAVPEKGHQHAMCATPGLIQPALLSGHISFNGITAIIDKVSLRGYFSRIDLIIPESSQLKAAKQIGNPVCDVIIILSM
jgi:hypothetical protein